MTVTVKKIGGSVAVVIPKAVAMEMGLVEGTPLDVSSRDDAIVMRRQGRRPRRRLGSIVNQIKAASYKRQTSAMASDEPIGKEIW